MWNALESLKFRKSKLEGNINSTKFTDFLNFFRWNELVFCIIIGITKR